jgi:folate-dependent phosphoribosylglycinamide formyltransferase PurN
MDAAVRYMREMNSDLGQKIDAVGTKVDAVGDKVDAVGTKVDAVGDKVDQSRIEITSEVRLNRDDFRSHLDERISVLEHELAQIKAKIML